MKWKIKARIRSLGFFLRWAKVGIQGHGCLRGLPEEGMTQRDRKGGVRVERSMRWTHMVLRKRPWSRFLGVRFESLLGAEQGGL